MSKYIVRGGDMGPRREKSFFPFLEWLNRKYPVGRRIIEVVLQDQKAVWSPGLEKTCWFMVRRGRGSANGFFDLMTRPWQILLATKWPIGEVCKTLAHEWAHATTEQAGQRLLLTEDEERAERIAAEIMLEWRYEKGQGGQK